MKKSIFHLQPSQAVNGFTGRSLIGKIQTGYVPFLSPSQWHGTHFYILIHFCLKCGFKSRRPDSGQAVVPWHVKEMYITTLAASRDSVPPERRNFMQVMDLTKIANGALVEKAQAAIEQVVQNMTDVNTPYKTKRSVTIKMTFAQDEERETAACEISVQTKLAPVNPVKTMIGFGRDLKTNELFVNEWSKQIPGQMSMDMEQVQPEQEKKAEDSQVIDYRKVKKA